MRVRAPLLHCCAREEGVWVRGLKGKHQGGTKIQRERMLVCACKRKSVRVCVCVYPCMRACAWVEGEACAYLWVSGQLMHPWQLPGKHTASTNWITCCHWWPESITASALSCYIHSLTALTHSTAETDIHPPPTQAHRRDRNRTRLVTSFQLHNFQPLYYHDWWSFP